MPSICDVLLGRKPHQPDLFGLVEKHYPEAPGAKALGTSMEAAIKVAAHASRIRLIVLQEYKAAYPRGLTADQAAKLVGQSPLYIRPRCTELKKLGLLEMTPERRKNDSGLVASVLRASPKAMEAAR